MVRLTAAETEVLPIDADCSFTNPPSEEWVYDLEADANEFPPGKFKTLFGKIIAVVEVTK